MDRDRGRDAVQPKAPSPSKARDVICPRDECLPGICPANRGRWAAAREFGEAGTREPEPLRPLRAPEELRLYLLSTCLTGYGPHERTLMGDEPPLRRPGAVRPGSARADRGTALVVVREFS